MTDIIDLDRKLSRAAQEGRGIKLSAHDLEAFRGVAGPTIAVAALPIEFPPRGVKAAMRRGRCAVRRPRPDPTSIYFVQAGVDGPVKIGQARDVSKRFATLQTASHEQLTLLATSQDYDEFDIHRFFAAERLRGEWFRPSPRLLAFVESLR